MPKEKFNPIAQLPELPGANIADEIDDPTKTSKYPPIEVKDISAKKPKIEIRLQPEKNDQKAADIAKEKQQNKLLITRAVILGGLIVLIVIGIFLTLQLVPRIMSSVPKFGQSLGSLFTPSGTTTKNSAPAFVELVPNNKPATSTVPAVVISKPATNPAAVKKPVVIKTPAHIVAKVISSNLSGYQNVVQFSTENVGGRTSGNWSFSVSLPSTVTPKYYSAMQSPLAPHSGIINTLTFTADPYNNTPIQILIYQ